MMDTLGVVVYIYIQIFYNVSVQMILEQVKYGVTVGEPHPSANW
jgi:hypothetical protein